MLQTAGDVRPAEVAARTDAMMRPRLVATPADVEQVIAEAWTDYKQSASPARREQLILHYAPLVSIVASKVAMRLPASVEHADLASYGMFGLIDAIEKFEPLREIKFETYASTRIRGAIIDELRAADWVPRLVRSKARALDRAAGELEAELHRAPTEAELAARLEIPVVELRSIYTQISNANLVALDELLNVGPDRGDQVPLLDRLQIGQPEDPESNFEQKETRFLLSRALELLGDREKIVVVLYYYECMTLLEIGQVLGVTESRVSQMHTAAMMRLRRFLTESDRD